MTTYKVRLLNPALELDETIEIGDDEFIVDAAEAKGLDLPVSCRAGSCFTCVGKVTAGTVEQENPDFLDPEESEAGYVLTCVARATSDCTIETHKEDELE